MSLRKKLCKINCDDIVLYRSITASRICKLRLKWMDIFAAGALFRIKFDLWLMYAFFGKIENYLHGFFRRVTYTGEIAYSVSPSGWGSLH